MALAVLRRLHPSLTDKQSSEIVKASLRTLIIVCGSIAGVFALVLAGFFLWTRWQYHLPSDQSARQYFQDHRTDFVRFAELLEKDTVPRRIAPTGLVELLVPPASRIPNPNYRELMSNIGAREVFVRPNGTIEFELWGFGCAPCTDSYKGMLYVPANRRSIANDPWGPISVNSLNDASLPKQNGTIADGVYVVPLESKWFIYRAQLSD
jgi:hypothetical protein